MTYISDFTVYIMTHTVSLIGMQRIICSFPVPGLDNSTCLGNRKLAGANKISVPRLAKGQFEITKSSLVCNLICDEGNFQFREGNMSSVVRLPIKEIKNNAWVTVNNDFLVTSGVICQWFSRVTKSRVKIIGKSRHELPKNRYSR